MPYCDGGTGTEFADQNRWCRAGAAAPSEESPDQSTAPFLDHGNVHVQGSRVHSRASFRPDPERNVGTCARPIGQDVPGDTFTSPGHAATITRRQETHQQDEPARRTGEKPAARFKSGAIIVKAALSLVAWLNCSTQRSVVEPTRCACRGHK